MLLFLAENFPHPHQLFSDPKFPPQFLEFIHGGLGEIEFVLMALKCLSARMQMLDEAVLYLQSGLLQFLVDVANQNQRYARWVCWCAANAIEAVPDCIEQAFEVGLFDFIERTILGGEYDAKSAASIAIVRIVNHRLMLEFIQDGRIMALLVETMGLLVSGTTWNVVLVLDCALRVARLENDHGCRMFLDAITDENYVDDLRAIADGELEDSARLAEALCDLL
jgi:hypothetical protein